MQIFEGTQNDAREWTSVERLWIHHWCNRAAKVEDSADNDRDEGKNANDCVNGQDGIAKAHEEEDKGEVDKPGYGLCHHGQVFGTFIHKHLSPSCLQRIARSLIDAHICPNPLLDERRKECGR